MDNTIISEIGSQGDCILKKMMELIAKGENKVFNTKEAAEYLRTGKSVIDKLRQNGEITYSKVGQTCVFTKKDLDEYLHRNQVKYAV